MRTTFAMLLTVAALATTALPALGQDEVVPRPVSVITNAEFCALVSEDAVACEAIITGMATAHILPEAFAGLVVAEPTEDEPTAVPSPDASTEPPLEPTAEATEEPAAEGGVGDTLTRDDLAITLLKADWKPDISDSFFKPDKGQKFVSFLVRYEAIEDGSRYNIIYWDALDKAGNRYEAEVLGQITPDLKVGELAKGKKIQGWVTYEVPGDVNELQVIESQVLKDDLAWTSRR